MTGIGGRPLAWHPDYNLTSVIFREEEKTRFSDFQVFDNV